jgi:shikimate kinase
VFNGIILLGPICAGKSTIAERLAARLGRTRVEMDEHRWEYFERTAYSKDEARRIFHEQGNMGVLRYSKPFEAQMVEEVLHDFPDHIIDFGAGHSVHEDAKDFARVQAALAGFARVILVLPSADKQESIRVLNERLAALLEREGIKDTAEILKLNEHFVMHPANGKLAKKVIYTEGKTVEETCDEVIAWLAQK